MSDNIEQAEILNEEPLQDEKKQSPCNSYPEGWKQATKTLWNGAIFTGILIILCAILVFFFPKEEIETIHIGAAPVQDTLTIGDTLATVLPVMQPETSRTVATSKSMNIGIGTLLVYFLILTFTALGAINTYQKGLIKFAAMFGKDGGRALDVIRWGFMLAMMGALFHFFIFYLPITDPETKRETATLILGNCILILSALMSIVGSLMLATANGCPDPSRKGALLMIVTTLILLIGAFVSPFAVLGNGWSRIVELVILVAGAVVFLVSWHKIVTVKETQTN